jgi:hypothetical protein
MKYILNFITSSKFYKNIFLKEPLKPVGRWGLEKCNIKIGRKADLANEDHCGPCGQHTVQKLKGEKPHIDLK